MMRLPYFLEFYVVELECGCFSLLLNHIDHVHRFEVLNTVFTVVLNDDRFACISILSKLVAMMPRGGKLDTMDEGQTTICRDDLAHLDF